MEAYSQRNSFNKQIITSNLRFRFTTFTKRRLVATISFGPTFLTTLFIHLNKSLKTGSLSTHYHYLACNRPQILYYNMNNAHYYGNCTHYNKNSAHSNLNSTYFMNKSTDNTCIKAYFNDISSKKIYFSL